MGKPNRRYLLTLTVSAAVFLLGAAGAAVLSRGAGSGTDYTGEHPLYISEVMTHNLTCPNADGVFCDWIEITNVSGREFNLSGYRLSDDITEAKYAFPVGTVIPAGGSIVVSCTAEYTGGLYAPFSLSRQGGETLVLMNRANIILDQVETLRAAKNCSQVRQEDGSFTVSDTPTPGYPNTPEGYAAYTASLGLGTGPLRLTEVMAGSTRYAGPDGVPSDWIEVYNASSQPVSLEGYALSDREGERRYEFPADAVLQPGEYRVVWCRTDGLSEDAAPFGLSKNGEETVVLLDAGNAVADRVRLPLLGDDESYALLEGGWTVTRQATPGYANTSDGYAAWLDSQGYGDARVSITILSPRNRTGLLDEDGDASDWLELRNDGDQPVDLEGWYLSDDLKDLTRWRLPSVTLDPGETLVVFASGKDRTGSQLHTDFALSAGETVCLTNPAGAVIAAVDCPALEEDHLWRLQEDGSYADTPPDVPAKE